MGKWSRLLTTWSTRVVGKRFVCCFVTCGVFPFEPTCEFTRSGHIFGRQCEKTCCTVNCTILSFLPLSLCSDFTYLATDFLVVQQPLDIVMFWWKVFRHADKGGNFVFRVGQHFKFWVFVKWFWKTNTSTDIQYACRSKVIYICRSRDENRYIGSGDLDVEACVR